jgi:hypothetical protein
VNQRHRRSLVWVLLAGAQAVGTPLFGACDIEGLRSPELSIREARAIRFETDIARRATAQIHAGEPFEIKVRRAVRSAQTFNNQPRYELAAYELQKLLFDAVSEVVPATALRSMALAEFRAIDPAAQETFGRTAATLFIVQCWLKGVKPHPVEIDERRFAADPAYARAISNLNVLTYLIEHKDSNLGNVMLSEGESVRVWAIDNGVAFASGEGDVGSFWRSLHVPAIDRGVYERLQNLDREVLDRQLGVVAEFGFIDGNWVPRAPGENLGPGSGVRRRDGVLQLGLTRSEIAAVHRRARLLLERAQNGHVRLLPASQD